MEPIARPRPSSSVPPAGPRVAPSWRADEDLRNAGRRHWPAITVAVAWELAREYHKVTATLLVAARDHALYRIPASAGLAEAEAIAWRATREFVARRRGVYGDWQPDIDLDILPAPRWRDDVLGAVTPLHEAVFRLHYGDGVSIEELAPRLRVDLAWVRPAREAVRELVRAVVGEDGVSTEGWDPARIDRLVARVALAASDQCPGPGGLGTDIGRAHGDRCPRCSRAFRLLRDGVISTGQLFPPPPDVPVPPPATRVLVVQVAGESRGAATAAARALPSALQPAPGLFVLPHADGVETALREAAELGTAPRTALRVAVAEVSGRIDEGALIGLSPEQALAAVQGLPWGEARGIDPLPEPLPEPPSAARWWAGAGLVASLALVAGWFALAPPSPTPRYEVYAERVGDRVIFDTDDAAWVDVLAVDSTRSEVIFHSEAADDKATLASGDGRYRLPADDRPLLVVSAPMPVADSAAIVAVSASADEARSRLIALYPDAAVALVR